MADIAADQRRTAAAGTAGTATDPTASSTAIGVPAHVPINVIVNGIPRQARVEPRQLLVHYLRETLALTGTHVGCDTSQCGACAVLMDGAAVKSCNVLAAQANGSRITTIEGLAPLAAGATGSHATSGGPGTGPSPATSANAASAAQAADAAGATGVAASMHPLQIAFWERHGLQCGFCTPGMVIAAYDLLQHNPSPSEAEIRHALEGNFCRCTGYHNIVRAVQQAAEMMMPAATTAGSTRHAR